MDPDDTPTTAGKMIGNQLAMLPGLSAEDAVRAWRFATDFYEMKDPYEIDEDSLDFILRMMERTTLAAMYKSQCIVFLNEAKTEMKMKK